MQRLHLFLFLVLFSFSLPALASDPEAEGQRVYEHTHQHHYDWDTAKQNVFIEVTPQKNMVQGGETIPVVIEQIIRPGWHTYWKNPGDSGEPMHTKWDAPEGFSFSDISWPTPVKLPFDPLVNYGYHGDTLLIQYLTLPPKLPAGPITIPVRFDILVCQDICIPEQATASIHLNPKDGKEEHNDLILNDAGMFMPIAQKDHNWSAQWQVDGDQMLLSVQTDMDADSLKQHKIEFFPNEYGIIQNSALPQVEIDGGKILLRQAKESFPIDKVKDKGGVLVLEYPQTKDRFGYDLHIDTVETGPVAAASPSPPPSFSNTTSQTPGTAAGVNLFQALVFAVIGGLILNLMPCVFPVLSMKVLSLAKLSEKDKKQARHYGLAYTAGIILSFLAIAGLLIILKSGGSAIGWGFHLQNPVVILLLIYLFFLIALNLSGFFEIGNRLMSLGSRVESHGLRGSFLTGILATIVATPCTAPYMAAALGYALVQPAFVALLIFAALGLGLALPYLLICFMPPLQKLMPRPGAWMVTFKEFLSFPMFGAVIWLIWVLAQPFGLNGVLVPLIGLLGLGFAIWLLKHLRTEAPTRNFVYAALSALIVFSTLIGSIYKIQSLDMRREHPAPAFGQTYSEDGLTQALATQHPVFVEMTAAWCVTCKVNHYRAIDTQQTRDILKKRDIIYLIGDWTNYEEHITAYLNRYGRNGVPIYVYYGRPDPKTGQRPEPQLLPQLLSPSLVAEVLDR
ncbi:MAG: thioredoxin family protein [Rhodospirillales bacterium]|nr:thioredoxin family protein [Rhodospirillales bacterium]